MFKAAVSTADATPIDDARHERRRQLLTTAWTPLVAGGVFAFFTIRWLLSLPMWTRLDSDEAINLAKIRLIERGYRLYIEVWSDQPPLLAWLTWVFEKLIGAGESTDASASRLMVAFLSAVFVTICADAARRVAVLAMPVGVATWLRQIVALLASFLAMGVIATVYLYVPLSMSLMIGLPAASLGGVAVYLAWLATSFAKTSRGRLLLAILSGVAFGAGFFMKFNIFMALPAMAFFLLLGGGGLKRLLAAFGGFAAVAIFIGVTLVVITGETEGQDGLYDQIIAPHITTITGHESTEYASEVGRSENPRTAQILDNLMRIWKFQTDNYLHNPLFLLALAIGFVLIRRKETDEPWLDGTDRPGARLIVGAALWLITALLLLPFASPVWDHHLTLVTMPGSLAVGAAAALSLGWLLRFFATPQTPKSLLVRWLPPAVGLLVVSATVVTIIVGYNSVQEGHHRLGVGSDTAGYNEVRTVLAAVREIDGDGWAIADDPMAAMSAGRLPLPEVAVPSSKRRRRGLLGDDMLVDLAQREQPDLLVLGRFTYSDAFIEAIERDYHRILGIQPDRKMHSHRVIYLRKDLPIPEVATELQPDYVEKSLADIERLEERRRRETGMDALR